MYVFVRRKVKNLRICKVLGPQKNWGNLIHGKKYHDTLPLKQNISAHKNALISRHKTV